MKRFRLRKKNQGSALVLVICTISVLSVIGSLLLVRTTNNRKMKEAEKRAQETFNIAENGSLEFVSALEMIAQDAIKSSFSDLLLQYGKVTTDAARMQRFNDIFVETLKTTLNGSDAAQELMKKALSSDDDIITDLTVSFGSVEYDDTNVASDTKKTNKITIRNAVFTYKDGDGNETTIKTDISVVADIPDVKRGMAAGVAAAFEDFILITNGDVKRSLATAVESPTLIDGNVYIAKDFVQNVAGATTFQNTVKKYNVESRSFSLDANPYKLLIRGAVDLAGSDSLVNVDSSASYTSGFGLWVENIQVAKGAEFKADGNCYVKDDLTVSGTNTKVTVSGGEYIGYSGETTRLSEKNSAITINKAENITVDLSGTDMLVLRGSSYIQDKIWGKSANSDADNLLGILQGESIAYKDMQSIYLVPSACVSTGKNPMLASEWKDASTDKNILLSYTFKNADNDSATLDLSKYVKSGTPYVTRYVRLDGGTSEYVYLYLNFTSQEAAAEYQKDFLATWKGTEIKNQLKNLKSSKIKLPKDASTGDYKAYTISNLIEYDGTGSSASIKDIYPDSSTFTMLRGKCNSAASQYNGLFAVLDSSVRKVIPADYDLIRSAVLREEALSGEAVGPMTVGTGTFWYAKGDKKSSALGLNGKKGIVIVNGNLTIDSQLYFEGLIIVTGNVNIEVTDIKLKSNAKVVFELLENDTVKSFFQGQDNPGTASNGGGYVSSDSVTIKFENWNKN